MKKKTFGNIAAIIILLAGIIVIIRIFTQTDYEKTDDAQVEQYISPINIKVPGYIKDIRFTEHQFVHKGDTLLIIDDREYKITLKQAEANLLDAQSGKKVVGNNLNTATSSANVFDSSIEEANIRISKLERDYLRHKKLLEKNASTPIIVEQYKTELEMAKARVNALKRQQDAAQSSVNEVNQRQENAKAAIMRAEAAVEMAQLNLAYTVITAPYDGYLGRRNIEKGQLVNPGQTITTIIPDTKKWVIANFKETQMSRIHIGQHVEINIDAISNKTFNGVVSAISSATGSKYSMIPTDNSAGNFVKIQQRVPVRIDFTDEIFTNNNSLIAAGMMCEITIHVENENND